MVKLAIPLRDTAAVFQKVISEKYPVRVGQQYGSLLAGTWMLEHDSGVSEEEARFYCSQLDFVIAQESVKREDEMECFWYLMQNFIRTPLGDRTISEIIQTILCENNSLEDDLQRHGIRIIDNTIRISHKCKSLDVFYSKSKWAYNYSKQLCRIQNSQCQVQTWFNTEVRNIRCISLPVSILNSESKNA